MALFEVLFDQLPPFVVLVTFLGAAAWLLWIDFANRVHRGFALFFVLQALESGLLLIARTAGDLGSRLEGYVAIALPFAILNVAILYHEVYGARPPRAKKSLWWLRLVLLVACLALEVAYWLDHGLISASPRTGGPGPLSFWGAVPNLTLALVALFFAREFTVARFRPIRRGLGLMALGFSLHPAFGSAFQLAAGYPTVLEGDLGRHVATMVSVYVAIVCILVLAMGLVAFSVRANRRLDPYGDVPRFVWVQSAAVVSGVLIGLWAVAVRAQPAWAEVQRDLLHITLAIWEVSLPLLLVFAVLRYRFLNAELGAKRVVKTGILGGSVVAAMFVVGEVPQAIFSGGPLVIDERWASILSVVAGGILMLFLHPLSRMAERASGTALPEARKISDLSRVDRLSLYKDQALIAWRDGTLSRKERLLLDQLAARIELKPEVTAQIEAEIVKSLPVADEDSGSRTHA